MIDDPEQDKHEWGYMNREDLTPQECFAGIYRTLKDKEVLSVGEQHDLNQDKSFNWIQMYQDEILTAFSWYQMLKEKEPEKAIELERLIPHGAELLAELQDSFPTNDQFREMHVGRFFTFAILPFAASAGYTDMVLEGFSPSTIDRSKDKTGDLLRMTMGMWLGMNIHGAYADGLLSTPAEVGNAVFDKAQKIKDKNPTAKVIIYNGATHNMTEPFKKMDVKVGMMSMDPSEWTYAPRAIALWGNKYGAIDLINGNREMPLSHFKFMQEKATEGKITRFSHGVDQKTYIFK